MPSHSGSSTQGSGGRLFRTAICHHFSNEVCRLHQKWRHVAFKKEIFQRCIDCACGRCKTRLTTLQVSQLSPSFSALLRSRANEKRFAVEYRSSDLARWTRSVRSSFAMPTSFSVSSFEQRRISSCLSWTACTPSGFNSRSVWIS